jgi:hypothetical protein
MNFCVSPAMMEDATLSMKENSNPDENTSSVEEKKVLEVEIDSNRLTNDTPEGTMSTSPLGEQQPQEDCDYDTNCSRLYKMLEDRKWEEAADLLDPDDLEEPVIPQMSSPLIQARKWVVRREANGKLRWRMLPIHAAVIFGAPHHVVEAILKVNPRGALLKDDRGMLPLHLAFRHGAPNDVLVELLYTCPQAIAIKDRKGRIPIHCCVPPISNGTAKKNILLHTIGEYESKQRANTMSLYAKACCAEERNRTMTEASNMYEKQIESLQEAKSVKLEAMHKLEEQSHTDLLKRVQDLEQESYRHDDHTRVLKCNLEEVSAEKKTLTRNVRQLAFAFNTQTDVHEKERKQLELQVEKLQYDLHVSQRELKSVRVEGQKREDLFQQQLRVEIERIQDENQKVDDLKNSMNKNTLLDTNHLVPERTHERKAREFKY